MLTHVDFFAGIGGVSLAAEAAGFMSVAFCEIEPFCQKVLTKHWPEVPIFDDIRTLTGDAIRAAGIGRIDLLHASPPCQPFSIAGKQESTKDDRNLWPDTARLIGELQPRWVCIENVDNVVNLVLDDWISDLEGMGYETGSVVVPAAAQGAPHIRYRLFLVAHAECDESERERRPGGMGRETGTHQEGEEERQRIWDAPWRGGAPVGSPTGARLKAGTRGESGTVQGSGGCEESERRRGLLVNAYGAGCKEQHPPASVSQKGHAGGRHSSDGGAPVESSTGAGRGKAWGRKARSTYGAGSLGWVDGTDRQHHQLRLGGDAHELSDWMDRRGLTWLGWPAGMGPYQYDYEPTRTGGNKKNRNKRIKAIGNAVPPAQVYPILKAIAAELMKDQEDAA